ncbi:BTB/POZ domain-containing protein FBL11 [Quillaja saponaria]|uniref:BTB/POZ domain-containing protein FBL11 n=1 Tax=Quillaja saponaria TaxID=32244 RepID=A0AAD7Q764_QUISA|nr:BTB/POZ domain-containing protein FBL11 [Quillaja saponaria]
MASSSDDDYVILFCTNPNPIETETAGEKEILISTRDIHSWDFPTILSFQTVKVQAHRNRLIEQSSYFHGLFSGSFSESCLDSISVKWKVDAFLHILKHIYGCPLNVTSNKFLPLYEGSLFFGVETLLLKCNRWFSEVSSSHEFGSPQIQLDDLIEIWKFGLEHASEVIPETCTSYLARNFMWAMSSKFFEDVPYDMLLSCVKHPELTIDSEMHLADALVHWLETNIEILESERKAESNCSHILKQIRPSLLPLWFAAGKRNSCHFCEVAEENVDSIFRLTNIPLVSSLNVLGYQELNHLRIRLTEYSKRVNLSGSPQITSAIILLSVLHSSYMIEPMLRKSVNKFLINPEHPMRYKSAVPQGLLQTLSFEAVQEVDFSKCQRLHVEDAIECFCNSFPSLKILRAAYLLNINTTSFLKLVQKCPLVSEIDLTVDITPLIPALVSTESSSSAMTPPISEKPFSVKHRAGDVISLYEYGSPLSNIRKLTLEGRTDVCDLDLMYISKICVSLYHLNLKGCISVTDDGISDVIRRCLKLNSIVVCNTSFGKNSVLALSSAIPNIGDLTAVHSGKKHLNSLVSNFQVLHMGGCKGINESSLLELMSQTQHVNSLCLRDTESC